MISIVIPAYNEEKRLGPTLSRIKEYMKDRDNEIIVVSDGSTDGTVDVARSLGVEVLESSDNNGKGSAVRKGMLHAKGDYILFSDADLSTPIEELDKMLPLIEDVAIGSRRMKGSNLEVRQPIHRELMGGIFNGIVRLLAVKGISDTQCGFKLFTQKAARELFSRQRLEGFSFDVEILHLARKSGMDVKEIPVVWRNDEESKVSSVRDSFRMFRDVLRIRWMHNPK